LLKMPPPSTHNSSTGISHGAHSMGNSVKHALVTSYAGMRNDNNAEDT